MRKIIYIFIFILSAAPESLAAGRTVHQSIDVAGKDKKQTAPRYNDVQWKASHNSYAKQESLTIQLGDFRIRSIELDIRVEKRKPFHKVERAPDSDFLVYHTAMDDYTNCRLLSECLVEVSRFHENRPDHQVITIFFDMKGVGEPGHSKDELYALFEKALPEGSIFAPGDLLSGCPEAVTLQESVTREGCGWPMLSDLRGKFILVVSDGREDIRAGGYDPRKDLLFLVTKSSQPERMNEKPDVVFFNMSGPDPFARAVWEVGFVSRCYWIDKEKAYIKARDNQCHHLATDKIDPEKHPWAGIHDEIERPFGLMENGPD